MWCIPTSVGSPVVSVLQGSHSSSALCTLGSSVCPLPLFSKMPLTAAKIITMFTNPYHQECRTIVKYRQGGKIQETHSHSGHRMFIRTTGGGETNLSLTAFSFWIALNTSSWAEIAFAEFRRDFYSCHI